jgi:UDP-GlcNAc:undecaprenyl-phosphate GlcNAc-1-phosphate transferase
MTFLPSIVALVLSAAAAMAATPLMIKVGHRYGLLDVPGRHKRHKRPTPYLGGVALFITVWLTVIFSCLVFPPFYGGFGGVLFYVLGGALIIVLVGLSDDMSPVSAWVKLVAQVAAGLVLYLGGLRVELVSSPYGSIHIGSFSVVITVLWVVILSNAINLIDGLDGLAGGVSLIGAVTMSAIGMLYHVGPVLVFIYALLGFLAVFLYYNRYPARIFLGDSGSMQIGYYFAVLSLAFPLKSYTITALYVPLLALGVPLLEAVSSFARRLVSGKNIMKPDRRHLFHYLALAGLSPRRVVLVFYLMAVIFGGFALAMFFWNRLVVLGVLVVFMVVIFVVFLIFITNFLPRRKWG